jgi:hypothetical protein
MTANLCLRCFFCFRCRRSERETQPKMVQPTANAFITDFDLHLRTDSPQHPITFVQLIPEQRWAEKRKETMCWLLAAADGSLTMFSS